MEPPKRYFKFFRNVRNEPRRFQYNPRVFDADNEEWEARKKRIEREVAMERGEQVDYQSGHYNFRESWSRQKRQAGRSRGAMLRLLVILIALIGFSYWALQWLEKFE